jgi:hypothetical protein
MIFCIISRKASLPLQLHYFFIPDLLQSAPFAVLYWIPIQCLALLSVIFHVTNVSASYQSFYSSLQMFYCLPDTSPLYMFTAHDTAPHGVTDSVPKEWILLTLNTLASVQAVHNLFHIPTFMFLISII